MPPSVTASHPGPVAQNNILNVIVIFHRWNKVHMLQCSLVVAKKTLVIPAKKLHFGVLYSQNVLSAPFRIILMVLSKL